MKHKRLRIGIFTQLEHTIQREVTQSVINFASRAYGWGFDLPRPIGAPWKLHPKNPLDGCIAWPAAENLAFLRSLKIPLVCLGSNVVSEFPCVAFDNEEAGRRAARYFIERGIKRFAVLLGEESLFCKLRARGFEAVANSMKSECRIFQINKYLHDQSMCTKLAADIKRWMDAISQPAGLLVDTDLTGFIAVPAIREAGIKIPEELSILSVGSDSLLCDTTIPTLSSVLIPAISMGIEAAKMLQLLLTNKPSTSPLLMLPPIRIVERDSSNPLFVGDEIVTKALRLIHEYASTPFTVADLLKVVPASRRSLEVRFKKAVGRTLQKEIWRAHLEKAKLLLAETQLSMPDIADRSGFPDAQRLCEVFKREIKESPTAYRRRCGVAREYEAGKSGISNMRL